LGKSMAENDRLLAGSGRATAMAMVLHFDLPMSEQTVWNKYSTCMSKPISRASRNGSVTSCTPLYPGNYYSTALRTPLIGLAPDVDSRTDVPSNEKLGKVYILTRACQPNQKENQNSTLSFRSFRTTVIYHRRNALFIHLSADKGIGRRACPFLSTFSQPHDAQI
jgi:hypothetical protein